ncbi:MAG: WecB/TagA/CpsF family glycosyltransferase [Drouetiella hepatica Uher 2000/2452]|uniref:WecB/TagA/CpsF family glycosyltransferase n=1 Tax=Drouetiella hepatica Uher 2000/2452 TaxID=904376 RepID=A0A951QEB2_9CYAN|nr:WecB/TagA/CpsF family glycosyltransferase [Drouetiella hepatica Uher 2000/2452]
MKTLYSNPNKLHSRSAAMPQWISSMGLEWLYKLVLKLELLFKSSVHK